MTENLYAALTGDLVASRNATPSHRKKIQQQTITALRELNLQLEGSLASPLVLTAGDEIQGLFEAPSRIVPAVQAIKDRHFGAGDPSLDIVFGVGWGSLSTGLITEAESVEQLDGPCFHLARETLARAKKKKIWVVFKGFGEVTDRTLTSLFELMGAIRAGWTATQSRYIAEARRVDKRIDVAKLCGVSPSVITESLQLSRFDAVLRGEETARRVLQAFDREASRSTGGKRR